MRIAQTRFALDTKPHKIKEITAEIAGWVEHQGMGCGLLTIYIPHTSASLLIQEHASPDVKRDLDAYLQRASPKTRRSTVTNTKGRTTCRRTSRAC